MKKSSKLVSLILALMLVVSSFTCLASVSASAAEPSTTLIYFKAPSYWGTVKTVFCNLFNVYGGSSIKTPAWQTKSTRCTKVAGTTDLFAYDTSKLVDEDGKSVSIEAGADYALNFSATTKEGDTPQTGDVLLGVECLGDTVYCLGEDKRTENSVDSKKLDYIGGWENNSDQYGAKAVITSTGKIIPPTDSYFPAHQPKAEILSQFLHSYAVKNAEIITSEIVQADCAQIGVAPIDVYNYYADAYASELDDPETYPETASLTTIAALLGVDPTPTTTEEPTTEEPTTAPEPTTDPEPTAPASTYIVAGTENLCGSNWDGSDTNNEMLQNSDGTYSKTYENVDAIGEVQVKVVEHQDGVEDPIWHGYPGDYNVAKIVSSPCDVTVTYNPETGEITLTGAGVEDKKFEVDAMRAVGNGDGTWLNGANWTVDDDANKMEEIADNVYQIKYEDVEEFDTYQVKFAANGSWNDNWGGVFTASGEETDAVYNSSDNITFAVEYELADVTLTIDLTNFNATTKEGAKFRIDIVDATPKADIYGDVNGDGVITIEDASLIQKAGLGIITLDEAQTALADVNGDGRISILDVTLIQKYLAGGYQNTGLVGQTVK